MSWYVLVASMKVSARLVVVCVLVVFYTHKYTAIYLLDIATLTKSYMKYICPYSAPID